jgi:hypothetical protein
MDFDGIFYSSSCPLDPTMREINIRNGIIPVTSLASLVTWENPSFQMLDLVNTRQNQTVIP